MQEMMQTQAGLKVAVLVLFFSSRSLTHLVTGRSVGVVGVAVAALAARSAGDVPRVGGAAVAVLTDHVGLAGTLTAELIALTVVGGGTGLRSRAHRVTHALCTEEGRRQTGVDL